MNKENDRNHDVDAETTTRAGRNWAAHVPPDAYQGYSSHIDCGQMIGSIQYEK